MVQMLFAYHVRCKNIANVFCKCKNLDVLFLEKVEKVHFMSQTDYGNSVPHDFVPFMSFANLISCLTNAFFQYILKYLFRYNCVKYS